MPDSSPNLAAALALADAGVKIFPAGVDKRPLFSGWQEIATTEGDIIADWWHRAPHALPAIPCGVNGLLVIDLDRHGNGSDGVSAFKELIVAPWRAAAGRPDGQDSEQWIPSLLSAAAGRAARQWPRQSARLAATCEAPADL